MCACTFFEEWTCDDIKTYLLIPSFGLSIRIKQVRKMSRRRFLMSKNGRLEFSGRELRCLK